MLTADIDLDTRTPCAGDARRWFSLDPVEMEAAKAACVQCPARRACGELAVRECASEGISAGFDTGNPNEWHELQKWLGIDNAKRRRHPGRPRQHYACTGCDAKFSSTKYQPEPVRCWACRSGLIDGGPTVAHIKRLHAAGEPYRSISVRAGLGVNVAASVARGSGWVYRDTETAILALEPLDEVVHG